MNPSEHVNLSRLRRRICLIRIVWLLVLALPAAAQAQATYIAIQSSGPSFGVGTNGFGFVITGTTNLSVVVQACTNLLNGSWRSVGTNTLTEGWSYFSDPGWSNEPAQFYRVASMTSSGFYSSNVVGYVSVTVHGGGTFGFWGLQMIANPLNTMNNTVGSLIPFPPEGTIVYKFRDQVSFPPFQIATYLAMAGWDHPEYTLNPGEGALVLSPTNWANTFVGEVLQGALTNSYPAGFSIRASQVPQAGTLTALGLGAQLSFGDTVYQITPAAPPYESDVWLGYWPPPEPSLNLGESFWLQTSAAGSWNQTFNFK